MTESNGDDMQTAKQANFAFPSRASTPRNKSKLSASVPGSDDEDTPTTPVTRKDRPPPLGPGIPSATGTSPSMGEISDRYRSNNSYRERSASRGLPNIEIPPPLPAEANLDIASTQSPLHLPVHAQENTMQLTPTSRPPINRKRSQSSVTGVTTSRHAIASNRDRNLASPGDFQFPPPSDNDVSLPAILPLRTHNKASPNHASISSTSSVSPSAHQTTYSLDASALGLPTRRIPPIGTLPLPPSIHRAQSANAVSETHISSTDSTGPGGGTQMLPRKPSLSRQASVAVMENVQHSPPLVPPSKPFARPTRDRSGSGASQTSDNNVSTQSLGMLGLKDVLKVSPHHRFPKSDTKTLADSVFDVGLPAWDV